jgi:hypothetical protein
VRSPFEMLWWRDVVRRRQSRCHTGGTGIACLLLQADDDVRPSGPGGVAVARVSHVLGRVWGRATRPANNWTCLRLFTLHPSTMGSIVRVSYMGILWTTFSCTRRIAEDWKFAMSELGALIFEAGVPEPGTATHNWTREDWNVWRLGGCVKIDSEISGAVSFWQGRDCPVVASHLGSPTLLRIAKAMGATEFSSPHLVGDACESQFRISCGHLRLPAASPPIGYTSVSWPNNESLLSCKFTQIIGKNGNVVVETGPVFGCPGSQYLFVSERASGSDAALSVWVAEQQEV